MKIELEMSTELEKGIKEVVIEATREVLFLERSKEKLVFHQEWMNVKEAAKYAGVSYNTFIKFREMGLRFSEINGVKRVSKTMIDNFLNENSY